MTSTSLSSLQADVHHRRTSCRGCGQERLQRFLSLGRQPLANAFLDSPDQFELEQAYPLDVYLCESCALVQLADVIHPEVLFRNYVYVTGTSETMAAHNANHARQVCERLNLGAADLVVEVASNDGSLLGEFQKRGVRTLGIEPACNIADMARSRGVDTIGEFFSCELAQRLRAERGAARAVIANNVLAHVDHVRDFMIGCREMLSSDGLAIIEAPYLGDLLERVEYDTIYHEHLCYFSVMALQRLCDQADLSIVRVEHLPVHGGSLRIYAGPAGHYHGHSADVQEWTEREAAGGLDQIGRFKRFANDVEDNRGRLVDLLSGLRGSGRTLAGYGAPAKGNTLLNYCRIGPGLISFTVDKNPLKIGRYTPGMHLPVHPPSRLLESMPDYVLILAWNFADEVIRQQDEYRKLGGRFIIPIPDPKVI